VDSSSDPAGTPCHIERVLDPLPVDKYVDSV
jgi:hypothetical protein